MGWEQSDRRSRLPRGWATLVENTRTRAGGRCQATMHDGTRCSETGTDCDHIIHGDNHEPSNLQWLCSWHHNRKTARESKEAHQRRVKDPTKSSRRPQESHFGLK
jgi:5-methylcytosine-specific restriction protein A